MASSTSCGKPRIYHRGKKITGLTTIGTGRTGGRDLLLVVHLPLQCSVSQNSNNNIATGHNYKAVQLSHLNRKQSHQKSGRQRVEAGSPFNNRAAKYCTLRAPPSVEFLSTGTTIQRSQSFHLEMQWSQSCSDRLFIRPFTAARKHAREVTAQECSAASVTRLWNTQLSLYSALLCALAQQCKRD